MVCSWKGGSCECYPLLGTHYFHTEIICSILCGLLYSKHFIAQQQVRPRPGRIIGSCRSGLHQLSNINEYNKNELPRPSVKLIIIWHQC